MRENAITSVKNPLVQSLARLREARGRREGGLFLVEGEKLLLEALAAGLRPRCLLWDPERAPRMAMLAADFPCERHPVAPQVLARITDTVTPQGCCAAFEMPRPAALSSLTGHVALLDGVQDPGNCGTIWRTADAAGFGGVVFAGACADPMSPKVQRAAMGSGFRVPWSLAENAADAVRQLRAAGHRAVATALNGRDVYDRAPTDRPLLLIIGSEAHGVSPGALAAAEEILRLPMRGGAESLNAAVAAGIMMYELTRPLGSAAPADRS